MNEDLAYSLINYFIEKDRPFPTTEESECEKCGEMTRDWSTGYPKDRKINWKCKPCKEKEAEETEKMLKEAAEKDPNSFMAHLYRGMHQRSENTEQVNNSTD